MSKSRMYPRFLAHSLQRLTTLQANFGVRVERTITDFRAINEIKSVAIILNLRPNHFFPRSDRWKTKSKNLCSLLFC